ncbi:hypothetical protein [uncultured Paenibacillus sp.]|uniref:hypothetical protein n=1 Tax=uncultured Paenibacillus sp. TaxID=227322 RepID=UPI0015B0AE99|nr:hypothetical protein [uncultured Paenibacillus sp.]
MGLKPWVTRQIRSTQAQLLMAVLLIVGISVWTAPYFSESVFYMHGDKYRLDQQDQHQTAYRSIDGQQVVVLNSDDAEHKRVKIGQQDYAVNVLEVHPVPRYEVIYPSGEKYKVDTYGEMLMSVNDQGEMIPEISWSINGVPQPIDEKVGLFSPSMIVRAAFPEYHTRQGSLLLYYGSFPLMLFGWCLFRYIKLQNVLFHLSLHGIWVRDAEPSDFYYFSCKTSGIAIIGLGVFVFVKSFFI